MQRNRPVERPGGASKGSGGAKIPSLDGLRAFSIVIVFLSHVFPTGGRFAVPGAFGVTIFFFLSGFLITTLLRREYDAAERISFKGFYIRRVLRIYPPFLTMFFCVGVLCVTSVLNYQFGFVDIAVATLQASNYRLIMYGQESLPPGAGVLWSLAVEEHFYLFFPLIYFGLRRHVKQPFHQALILWAMCVAFFAWRWLLVSVLHVSVIHLRHATDTRLDSILFGCALAVFGNPVLDASKLSKRMWTLVLLPLGGIGLAFSHVIPGDDLRESLKYSIEGVALIPVFCAAIRYPDWGPLRLLNLRPVRFLGEISYSFYLVHHVILIVLERYFAQGDLRLIVVGFACSVLVAWAMQVWIELPSNRLRHRLASAKPAEAVSRYPSPGSDVSLPADAPAPAAPP